MIAAGGRVPGPQAGEKPVAVACLHLGVRAADPRQRVRVAAADRREPERGVLRDETLDEFVVFAQPWPVPRLGGVTLPEQRPDVVGQRYVILVEHEEVVDRHEDAFGPQVRDLVEHIVSQRLHVPVRPLRHPDRPEVHL